MYKFILILLCGILGNMLMAQELVFINTTTQQVITVKPGAKLFLAYKGYNHNVEFAANIVMDITDSTVILGSGNVFDGVVRKPNASLNSTKVIRLADITHFRKRSLGGQLARDFLRIGVTVGAILGLRDLYQYHNLTTLQTFGVSIGVGVLASYTVKWIFPENANNAISDGWTYAVKQ